MTTTNCNPQERTARELLTQQPLFVGRSGDIHVYWDGYDRSFAVISDSDAETVALADTPFNTPLEYCEHIRDTHGWDVGPHIGGNIVADLVAGVQQ